MYETCELSMASLKMMNLIQDRLYMLFNLPEDWKDSSEDESEDVYPRIHRSPPSEKLCEFALNLFSRNSDLFTTNTDLPHICPMDAYPGLTLDFLNGTHMMFYDRQDFPDGSSLQSTYHMYNVHHNTTLTGNTFELADDDFIRFVSMKKS